MRMTLTCVATGVSYEKYTVRSEKPRQNQTPREKKEEEKEIEVKTVLFSYSPSSQLEIS